MTSYRTSHFSIENSEDLIHQFIFFSFKNLHHISNSNVHPTLPALTRVIQSTSSRGLLACKALKMTLRTDKNCDVQCSTSQAYLIPEEVCRVGSLARSLVEEGTATCSRRQRTRASRPTRDSTRSISHRRWVQTPFVHSSRFSFWVRLAGAATSIVCWCRCRT